MGTTDGHRAGPRVEGRRGPATSTIWPPAKQQHHRIAGTERQDEARRSLGSPAGLGAPRRAPVKEEHGALDLEGARGSEVCGDDRPPNAGRFHTHRGGMRPLAPVGLRQVGESEVAVSGSTWPASGSSGSSGSDSGDASGSVPGIGAIGSSGVGGSMSGSGVGAWGETVIPQVYAEQSFHASPQGPETTKPARG